jgi:anti-anti-sigma regulatory factor
MLKITNTETDSEQRWTLYGQLAGPWVAELRSSWQRARATTGQHRRVVDLSEVTFIDEAGEQVLRAMRNHGVTFIAQGIATKQLLSDLKKKTDCLRRCISHMGYTTNGGLVEKE